MPSDLIDRLAEALDRGCVDRAQVARVLRVSPRTVSRWLQHRGAPRRDPRERLAGLLTVLAYLLKTLKPRAAYEWLSTRNPLLSSEKPVDLLQEGRHREVLGALDQLGEGVFV